MATKTLSRSASKAKVAPKAPLALSKGQLFATLTGVNDPWGKAMELVDYPVMIKSLYFDHEGEQFPAVGTTNTDRDTEHLAIVVDRQKDGTLNTVATVTDTYGTIPPAQTYEMLMNDLNDMKIVGQPTLLYVSGNGGRQVLSVDIEGQLAPNCKDVIGMQVKLFTSLDGSKRHSMQLVARDKTNNVEFVGIGNELFNLNARHTTSIADRHIAFSVTIGSMIKAWNEKLMPFMALMGDATFDRATAVELLRNITIESKLAATHTQSVENAYLSKMMDEGGDHSIYTVMSSLSQYVQDQAKLRPEHADKMRAAIDKVARKNIEAAFKQLGVKQQAA